MKKSLFTIAFIALVSFCFAQQLSMEHDKFVKEFSSKLNNSGDIRPNSRSMSKEFTNFWISDSINYEEKNNFIRTVNLMASKGCKDYPDFVCFADNAMMFKRKNISSNQYRNYEKALNDLLNDGKRPNLKNVSEFITMINSFVNKDIILTNARTYWKVDNKKFEITYEKDFIIEFYNVDLIGFQGVDSLKIYNTTAKYYPLRNHWEGKTGTVGWERVGYSMDSIKAELNNYSIDMRTISYTADSAVLTNKFYFKEELLGKIVDKAENIDNPSKSNYPRFISYKQHFVLKDIYPDVDYEGGFSMRGRSFVGSGTKENLAKMKIVRNDSISLVASSDAFFIDNEMMATNCAVTLHLGEDSIYHPYLTFRYHKNQRYVELIRTKDDMSQINYINTYHKISMDFTWMRWVIDKSKIEFNTISAQQDNKEALFESLNYYTITRYREMRKRDPQHPLEVVTNFVSSWAGHPEFYLEDLVNYMGYGKTQVLQLVLSLAYQGFLSYEQETEFIRVYPIAWEFMEAHRGTKDSDVVQFHSTTDANTTNAELSLLNFDLKINGIYNVHLSDSQNVNIFPIDKKITLKKDLTFLFDGTIQTSQFYFYGSNFKFDYDKFMIDLVQCDSMKMVAATDYLNAEGNPKPAIVRNKLEQINGQFFIDNPMNKSGRKDFPEYPRFVSNDKSYVYYDNKSIYDGVYERERFYFEIDPFQLDSIKGYDRENLRFKGRLYSGAIFPVIEETLVLRNNDFSLGFNTKTGPAGLPLYEGKATYWNEIDLSNHGLRGVGKIDYLTSSLDADYLIFFPDQMKGHSQSFEMRKQKAPTEFPTVKGRDNTLDWYVSDDQFFIKKDSVDFNMFDNKAVFDGDLNLSTTGLAGDGTINIDNASIKSSIFNYKKEEILADTSDFYLFTETILNVDFESKNVNSKINFDDRQGKFKSNGKLTTWRFPKNKYMSEMSDMTWHMDKKELESNIAEQILAQIKNVNADDYAEEWESKFTEGPKFTSIHYQQDSLYFFSPRVVYDYENNLIQAEDVRFIRVADAMVYTDVENEKVVVEREAVMRPLNNARIIVDTTSKYHTIYNAVVNIQGRNNYTASGDYDYISTTKEPQKIHFDKISVSGLGNTQASGKLTEDLDFKLSPHFGFQGDVNLLASKEHLDFNGATKIIHNCDTTPANWMKFRAEIDPEEIYIPVDTIPYSINNVRLSNSLVLTNTNNVYPSFIGRKNNQYDQELLSIHGLLTYDQELESYIITSREKMENTDTIGNYLQFNKFSCAYYGEGLFSLSKDFGLFKPNAIGSFEYTPGSDTIELNVAMILDAYFSKDAQKLMADKINKTPGLSGLDLRGGTYEKAVYQYLDPKQANKWFSDLSLGNFNKQPDGLSDKFVFTDVDLVWNKTLGSFVYYGPIGVANIGKEQVNKQVFGIIRVEKSRRGDAFEFYLEPETNSTYYFRYANGILTAISTDEEFNNKIAETKAGQRELKVDGVLYQYGLGSSVKMREFYRDMKRALKIDD